MSNIPAELKYTASHEWIKNEDGTVVIGLTDFAQNALGDIVFIDLPQEGDAGCEAVLLQQAADRNVGVLPGHGADPLWGGRCGLRRHLRGGLLWLRGLCLRGRPGGYLWSRLPGRLRLCRFAAGFAGLNPRRGFLPQLLDGLQGRAAAH